MNSTRYRLVFSKLRGMLVAVEETATGTRKSSRGETSVAQACPSASQTPFFALRQMAFAALLLPGALPAAYAQMVAAPGSGAQVIQTPNGLPQVNVARPSGAGVSVNTYSQFDVQKNGAILNNSPVMINTQQAGMINGNPNYAAGQSAKIIVNQVNSSAASQINGALEVAGSRAEVVIANGSGISVNGGSFLNTSRAILTTGTPNYGADGSLTGFNVNVNIGSATETHELNAHETHSHSNVGSSSQVTSGIDQTSTYSLGSIVSADGVTVASGKDIIVAGSTIAGTNDVTLTAAHDVRITASQDTRDSSTYYQKKESGLGTGGGIGISVGNKTQTDTTNTSQVTNTGSTIGSISGNLTIAAGNDLHVTGSDLIAAKNIVGTGANVIIDAATNTAHHDETHEVRQSGFTLALKAPVIDAISNAVDQAHAAGNSQDSRAAALHGIAAASSAWDANMAAGGALNSLASGQTPEMKVELSYGSSSSKSTFAEDSTTQKGSSVTAGGTAAFVATGNGEAGSGNVTIAGSNVSANDVLLAAKNQVNLVNTTDTDSTRSTNESKSASVGISYGTGGWGVDGSMSKADGDANSDAAMQNNTHVTAANGVTIVSGGDMNIVGSNVTGKQVTADIGGNLNIASVQDTMQSSAHQDSSGGGFSASMGGASGSFSSQHGSASGSYAGVNEQAGIQAGDGGFDINVKGNTDLTGAYIASNADASKNALSTGTLSFSDMQNQSNYSASSSGFSAGGSFGNGGNNYATTGPGSVHNAGGVTPMLSQHDSGSDSAITQSGISAGTINVTDTANQTQDVASLNRDTSSTNGTVSKLPDVNNLLSNQADMMSAASAAGEAVSRRIGDYADSRMKEAIANGDQAGVDAWDEGGDNRIALHVVGGALIGGLGGGGFGSAFAGAAGAGLSAALAPQLNSLSKGIADSTGSTLLGNLASNVLASAGGALVGGSAGAFTASNADLYNRQLHPKEETLADRLADESGGKYTAQQIEDQLAQMNLTANGQTESGGVRVAVGDQPNDGTSWTPYGVNQAGQQVWAQSLGAGDPNLQAYIVNGAQGSGLTYQATTTGSNPGLFRLPDFVNFQVDYFVGSVWGTFTRDGNSFFGYGVNLGIPNSVGAGVNVSAGYLNTTSVSPGQTNNFAGGYAGGGSALYGGLGGGIMVSPGNGTATVIGFGAGTNVGKTDNPASVGWGFSNDQGKTGIRW